MGDTVETDVEQPDGDGPGGVHLWEVGHPYYCSEDWLVPDPDDYGFGEPMPGETLELCFMLQCKGVFLPVTVGITRQDEPAVREWLALCWRTVAALWAPIDGVIAS